MGVKGRLNWSLATDENGHREYIVDWLVRTPFTADGPATVYQTPGLPPVGYQWQFGNDYDPWAFCMPNWIVAPVLDRERGQWWVVTQTFATRPHKRCQDDRIENPIDEPVKIKGTSNSYTKATNTDRDGVPIRNKAHEIMTLEKTVKYPSIELEFNTLWFDLPLFTQYHSEGALNDSTLWGIEPGKVQFSNFTWERNLYGLCNYYYTLQLRFDIKNDELGFTEQYESFGNLCFEGWCPGTTGDTLELDPLSPDPLNGGEPKYKNPLYFEKFKWHDKRESGCFHDVFGRPALTNDDIAKIEVNHFPERNLYDLGIPATLM